MAFDFPSSPAPGNVFTPAGGPTWQWDGTTWLLVPAAAVPALTAESRNRIVNGAMQVSQENGNTIGTVAGYHAADQWLTTFVSSGAFGFQRVQVATPNGSVNRIRLQVNTADAAVAAGDILYVGQYIEGIRIADFGWGAAGAKQVVLRFGFKGPAGTYSVSVNNGGFTRAYLANFTISAGQANTDTVQTFIVPGDTTGTWPVDTSRGMAVTVCLAAGTTYQGAAGWNAGNFYGTASNSNGMATAGNVFELFDAGLYLDRNNTGLPPPWVMPDEAQELAACQRYWQRLGTSIRVAATAVQNWAHTITLPVVPRTLPAASITAGARNNVSSVGVSAGFGQSYYLNLVSAAAGDSYALVDVVVFNARM